MTNDDPKKLNREVAEWLVGRSWHEIIEVHPDQHRAYLKYWHCSCGIDFHTLTIGQAVKHAASSNPNYILHPVDLLREMMKRDDWHSLKPANGQDEGFSSMIGEWDYPRNEVPCFSIEIDYITDNQTGLLLLKAAEWMRKEVK